MLFEVNGERKLITSVAAGRKFKRNMCLPHVPTFLSLRIAQLLETGFWLKGSVLKVKMSIKSCMKEKTGNNGVYKR